MRRHTVFVLSIRVAKVLILSLSPHRSCTEMCNNPESASKKIWTINIQTWRQRKLFQYRPGSRIRGLTLSLPRQTQHNNSTVTAGNSDLYNQYHGLQVKLKPLIHLSIKVHVCRRHVFTENSRRDGENNAQEYRCDAHSSKG